MQWTIFIEIGWQFYFADRYTVKYYELLSNQCNWNIFIFLFFYISRWFWYPNKRILILKNKTKNEEFIYVHQIYLSYNFKYSKWNQIHTSRLRFSIIFGFTLELTSIRLSDLFIYLCLLLSQIHLDKALKGLKLIIWCILEMKKVEADSQVNSIVKLCSKVRWNYFFLLLSQ